MEIDRVHSLNYFSTLKKSDVLPRVFNYLGPRGCALLSRVSKDLYWLTFPYLSQSRLRECRELSVEWYRGAIDQALNGEECKKTSSLHSLDSGSAKRSVSKQDHVRLAQLVAMAQQRGVNLSSVVSGYLDGRADLFLIPLLRAGVDVNARDSRGNSLLHLVLGSASDGSGKEVASGARNEGPATRLAIDSSFSRVKLLKDAGADLDAQNADGFTPLHEAVWSNDELCLDLLLSEGVEVDRVNAEGDSPLHWAADMGWCRGIEQLLLAGANPYLENNQRETPVELAINDVISPAYRGLYDHNLEGLNRGIVHISDVLDLLFRWHVDLFMPLSTTVTLFDAISSTLEKCRRRVTDSRWLGLEEKNSACQQVEGLVHKLHGYLGEVRGRRSDMLTDVAGGLMLKRNRESADGVDQELCKHHKG